MKSTVMKSLTICMIAGMLAFFGCGESLSSDDSEDCPAGGVFVTMVDSGYTVGKGAILSGNPATTPCIPGTKLSGDPFARYYDGKVYVVNRFGFDNIQILSPANNYETIGQYSTGNGTNPQDIAFDSPQKAYVSRLASAGLLIMNPTNGNQLGSVDLSDYDKTDDNPEAARMVTVGDRLFVALQRLKPDWSPAGSGMVAVIDMSDNSVAGSVRLLTTNPVTDLIYDSSSSKIFLGCQGKSKAFGNPGDDGAVESISVDTSGDTYTSDGVIIDEAGFGGDVTAIEMVDGKIYGVIGVESGDSDFAYDINKLVKFDPADADPASSMTTVWETTSYIPDMQADSNGYLYIADRDSLRPGIRILDTSDDKQYGGLIDVGLLPTSISIME